ncbi:MAG: DUF998 domain-containing protein [Betaproteobacteria bacterium]|nr:DUF998 domain-containing protein [Betaproteobacteria bacterium]MCL2885701.1 DUF998 domain-containing protein [Betaproteobacteria bacterium]
MHRQVLFGFASMAGALAFVVIVIGLHTVQTAYDPAAQLMSELALGPHGEMMLAAFSALAVSIAALALGLPAQNPLLRAVLILCALCFLVAGIFPLGVATELHVAAVALGFVTAGLAMYLLPSVLRFQNTLWRVTSWGFLAAMASVAALGHSFVPAGIAQRLATAALLGWLGACGCRLVRDEAPHV